MGFWDHVKRALTPPPIEPAPGSAAAEEAEGAVPITVALSVPEALDAASMHMISRGCSVEARAENTVTFVRHEGANAGIGCLLLLLGLLPGIIYLVMAGGDLRTTVLASAATDEAAGGCRLLVGGDDLEMKRELRAWALSLPGPSAPERS